MSGLWTTAQQWLQVRNLKAHDVDQQVGAFDPTLRDAMARETALFFKARFAKIGRSGSAERQLHLPERPDGRPLRDRGVFGVISGA